MRYLSTKKDRENMRMAWINGRETVKYKDIEYIAEEKIRFDGRKIFILTLWRRSEGRPSVNYSYYSEQRRNEQIEYYKKYADQREEYKNNKKPKPELVHNLKKGDIFYTSWGYDQTNYDYIVILEVKGKYAFCQRTSSLHLGTSGTSNVQEPIFCPFGDIFRMKIQGDYSGTISLRGSYPFLHTGIINDKFGGKNLRLDTFYQHTKEEVYHETMPEFGH